MKKLMLFFGIILLISSNTLFAANVDTFGIGAKATALGGAYAAYADDVYAVYYNPAGLTQIKNKQISIGSVMIDPYLKGKNYKIEKNGSTLAGPVDFEDESPLFIVPHLGFAMPINEKITIAITAYVPYGLHLRWDNTENFYQNPGSYNCYESWYCREAVTPTIGYKINEKFSIGFGVSLEKSEA